MALQVNPVYLPQEIPEFTGAEKIYTIFGYPADPHISMVYFAIAASILSFLPLLLRLCCRGHYRARRHQGRLAGPAAYFALPSLQRWGL